MSKASCVCACTWTLYAHKYTVGAAQRAGTDTSQPQPPCVTGGKGLRGTLFSLHWERTNGTLRAAYDPHFL